MSKSVDEADSDIGLVGFSGIKLFCRLTFSQFHKHFMSSFFKRKCSLKLFGQKDIGEKATRQMLMKLIPDIAFFPQEITRLEVTSQRMFLKE